MLDSVVFPANRPAIQIHGPLAACGVLFNPGCVFPSSAQALEIIPARNLADDLLFGFCRLILKRGRDPSIVITMSNGRPIADRQKNEHG